jgi:hypothetical protein
MFNTNTKQRPHPYKHVVYSQFELDLMAEVEELTAENRKLRNHSRGKKQAQAWVSYGETALIGTYLVSSANSQAQVLREFHHRGILFGGVRCGYQIDKIDRYRV